MNGLMLDFIVILFIAVISVVYMKKGFFRALFSFVTFFVSFFISALLQPIINDALVFVGVGGKNSAETSFLISLIVYIIISIILIVAFFVVGKILDLFAKFPIIKQLNTSGGLIVGVLLGIAICFFVFYAVALSAEWIDLKSITKIIESSYVSKMFYKNNLFCILQ